MKTDKKIENFEKKLDRIFHYGGVGYWDMDMPKLQEKVLKLHNTEVQKAVEDGVREFAEFVKTVYTSGLKLAKDDYMDIEVKRFDKHLKTYLQTLKDKDEM